MTISIRTNLSSLNAQRSLATTQLDLDRSLSRLSSGFRITRAGDDAAGLGTSTKLQSQIRCYGQAVRNANDGLSVVQTSEAALNEQANILTRVRELAMQAGSDGVGDRERSYIDREATTLLAELERISQVTEYNGTKLLDGSGAKLDFQVGIAATPDDVISLTTLNATTASAAPAAGPNLSTTQAAVNSVFSATLTATAQRTAAAVAAQAAVPDPTLAVYVLDATISQVGAYYYTAGKAVAFATDAMPVDATQTGAIQLLADTANGGSGGHPVLGAAYQAFSTALGSNGGDVAAAEVTAAAAGEAAALGLGASAFDANGAGFFAGHAAASVFQAASYLAGGGAAGTAAGLARLAGVVAPGGGGSSGGLGVAGLSLATKGSALAALGSVDAALAAVSSARAELGATGNRLQSAVANIQAFSESLSAADSRIRDVDVAEETSRMSRAQILMQAGLSVLAQANQQPQLALKLLG